MGRKGKTQKHTAKEIAGKVKAAKEKQGAAGGGGSGAATRKAAMGKASKPCDICMAMQPSPSAMKIHYESKHPKIEFSLEKSQKEFDDLRANIQKSMWK